MRTAVLGAGSWGTTFAKVLADAGGDVTLVGRRPELIAALCERHENPEYLPGVALPPALRATVDPAELTAFARTHLGGVKTPKQVHVWDDLPRSKVGKVLKTDIKARLRD